MFGMTTCYEGHHVDNRIRGDLRRGDIEMNENEMKLKFEMKSNEIEMKLKLLLARKTRFE